MKLLARTLPVLLCLTLLAGCGQETALDGLVKGLEERGFTVTWENLSPEEVTPHLDATDIYQLDMETAQAMVWVFASAKEAEAGVSAWQAFAKNALFAAEAPPHLYTVDSLILLYCGKDEGLLAALEAFLQPA